MGTASATSMLICWADARASAARSNVTVDEHIVGAVRDLLIRQTQINYRERESDSPRRSRREGAEDSDEKRNAHAELKDATSKAVVKTA